MNINHLFNQIIRTKVSSKLYSIQSKMRKIKTIKRAVASPVYEENKKKIKIGEKSEK